MIVAGFGFRRDATDDSLREALLRATGDLRIDALATVADKASAPVLIRLADQLDLPLYPIAPDRIVTQDTVTRSARVSARRGTGSVAEAAALAATDPDGRLIGARHVSRDGMACCALARKGTP